MRINIKKVFSLAFIIGASLIFSVFLVDSTSAQTGITIDSFDITPRTIPPTASSVNFTLRISQQDQNLNCSGGLDWAVFYAAAPNGYLAQIRSHNADGRDTSLPLSSNPFSLDFQVSNFQPRAEVINSGTAYFYLALGCNLPIDRTIYTNNWALSEAVPVNISTQAVCQLDPYRFELNKTNPLGPVQYSVGESVQGTINTRQGYDCNGYVANFMACPIVGGGAACGQGVNIGTVVIQNGQATINWVAALVSGISNVRLQAAAGTSSPVFSNEINILSAGSCTLSNFAANQTSPITVQFNVTANNCDNNNVTISAFTQDARGVQIPQGIVAQGQITNGQFTSSWTNQFPGLTLFFRACIPVVDQCLTSNLVFGGAPGPGPGPGQGGTDQNIRWGIDNPLITPPGGTQPKNVFDVIILITDWVLNIAGTLVVIFIIYGGVMFLISAGNPGKIQQAKNILFWALAGFAVVLIGKGFVFLVESVLEGNIPTF